VSPIHEVCEQTLHRVRGSVIRRPDDGEACPGVLVDAVRYERAVPGRSVEAARTASAVGGDQDHEDRDHCHRQTYSQPRLPVPLGPSVVPARVVHLEPPFRASSVSRRMNPWDHVCRHR
jgi:hypothetical protein